MTPYITVQEGDEFISSLLPSLDPERTAWMQLSEADKAVYITQAMLRIEALPYSGTAAVEGQANMFPRYGQDAVPEAVQQALAMEACAIPAVYAEAQERTRLQAQGVQSFSVGKLSESYGYAGGKQLYSGIARYLLEPYLVGGVPIDF